MVKRMVRYYFCCSPEEENDSDEDEDEAYFESHINDNGRSAVRPICVGEGSTVNTVHTNPRLGWGVSGQTAGGGGEKESSG